MICSNDDDNTDLSKALNVMALSEEVVAQELKRMAEAEDVDYMHCAVLTPENKNLLLAGCRAVGSGLRGLAGLVPIVP